MNWCNSSWPNAAHPKTVWDGLDQDQLLVQHQALKDQIEILKKQEMALRKYIVDRAFPEKKEGVNVLDLGNDYKLKSNVKFNYSLVNDNEKIIDAQNRIKKVGNKGAFIAERLFSWKCSFLLTEYRPLIEEKNESNEAKEILKILSEVLTITEATPTLEIVEPKKSK